MKTICIIIPYFGHFNNYFPLFLISCKNNPTVNWLVFTDDKEEYNWPPNVKVVYTTLDDIRLRVQHLFPFKISLKKPYKLCDYKPAYGLIFEKELEGFDFWGHCDTDMIIGNIRHFVTDSVLENDKVFSRGHFTLYRNNKQMNSYFQNQNYISYQEVFTSDSSYAFDEWGGVSKAAEIDGIECYDELVMDDIWTNADGFIPTKRFSGPVSPYHKNNIDISNEYRRMRYIVYQYNKGCLSRVWLRKNLIHTEEVLYVHFQKRSMEMTLEVDDLLSKYTIAKDCFIPYQDISKKNIKSIAGPYYSAHNVCLLVQRFAYSTYVKYIKSIIKGRKKS